jgi:hypothetical protein
MNNSPHFLFETRKKENEKNEKIKAFLESSWNINMVKIKAAIK